jgi:DNA-binding transcriptional LysR family regulator
MQLRQLRAFVEVAKSEHFGRAAAAMKITQPGLTQRIQAIERELGVQLLTRSAREVQLTHAGEALLPYAKRLVEMEDHALGELADIAAGRAGRLRIAYLLHGDVVLQGKVGAQFRRCYPSVNVTATAAHSRTNLELLCNGEADVAFVELPADVPDGIAIQSIGRPHQLMVALHLDHHLAKLERVPVAALRGVPLVLCPTSENPAMTAALKRWLARHTGTDLEVVAEEPADQAMQTVATSGGAAAVVNWWRASAGAAGVAFRPLTPAPLVEFSVAHRSGDPMQVLKSLLTVVDEIGVPTLNEAEVDGELL